MDMFVVVGIYIGFGDITEQVFKITKMEYNLAVKYALERIPLLWISVAPYIWYLVLLFKNNC